jgi:hypothetical protein
LRATMVSSDIGTIIIYVICILYVAGAISAYCLGLYYMLANRHK